MSVKLNNQYNTDSVINSDNGSDNGRENNKRYRKTNNYRNTNKKYIKKNTNNKTYANNKKFTNKKFTNKKFTNKKFTNNEYNKTHANEKIRYEQKINDEYKKKDDNTIKRVIVGGGEFVPAGNLIIWKTCITVSGKYVIIFIDLLSGKKFLYMPDKK